jgi:hypothetical protein
MRRLEVLLGAKPEAPVDESEKARQEAVAQQKTQRERIAVALLALWLMLLGKGVLEHRAGLVVGAAVGLGTSAAATWFLRTVSTRVQRRFRDKVTIALESHVARLQASIATIAHQERPEYVDRLSMLRNQVFVLDHMYMAVFSMLGWILRLGVTLALLASIQPVLLLLAVFAVPTVWTSAWRPEVERSAQESGAQASRLARHLFNVATTASPGKEVRVTGIGNFLATERRAAWELASRSSAAWRSFTVAAFGSRATASVEARNSSSPCRWRTEQLPRNGPGSPCGPPKSNRIIGPAASWLSRISPRCRMSPWHC